MTPKKPLEECSINKENIKIDDFFVSDHPKDLEEGENNKGK